jgi:hypothetical protein
MPIKLYIRNIGSGFLGGIYTLANPAHLLDSRIPATYRDFHKPSPAMLDITVDEKNAPIRNIGSGFPQKKLWLRNILEENL